MARPELIKPLQLDTKIKFRVQIAKWGEYQKDIENFKWIKLHAVRPSDSMLFEKLAVRGLFFDMLRFAACSRRRGWVVLGNDEPLDVLSLAGLMRLTVEEVFEPLKRLVETGRIKLLKAYPNPKQFQETEINSQQPPSAVGKEAKTIPNNRIKNKNKKEKEKERGEKEKTAPSFSDFSQKEKKEKEDAVGIFMASWQQLHCKRWETPDEYLPTGFERRDMRNLISPGNLEVYIAYAYHFHHHNGVGIKPGEKAPTIDRFLNKEAPKYCSTLRKGTGEWAQAMKYAKEFLAETRSRQ